MVDDKLRLYKGFALGQWRISPLKGTIEAPDGTASHVTPKAMDVLVCLAARSGEVVQRPTIFAEVWGDPPWSDEALTHCVGELRHAFNDRPEDPRFFQTITKRGYRLLVEAKTSPSEPASGPASDEDPPEGWFGRQFSDLRKRKVFQTVIGYPVLAWLLVQIVDIIWEYLLGPLGAPPWLVPTFVVLLALGFPVAVFLAWAVDLTPEGFRLTSAENESRPLFGMALVGVGSIALTIAALFVYFNAYKPPEQTAKVETTAPSVTAKVPKSIAVLRFLNLSGDPAVGYVSDGLTEELIHELTNLRTLKVAARTSIWSLSTTNMSIPEIIDRLGVEQVLEGSIRSEGDQIRVTAQLIDDQGFHLWSQAYDRELEDMLEVQKEIAALVVDELDLMLSNDQQARLKRRPTLDSVAYDHYLRGRQFLRQPGTEENIESAVTHFRSAIDADNRFPLAYAGLCEAFLADYRLTRNTRPFEEAEVACHRALTLDGGLAEVYTALGNLYRHSGQLDKAEQEYQVALDINPTLEEAVFGLGRVYQARGQHDAAEDMLRRTVELEPGYWGSHMGIGNFLFRQGRYEESVPYYEKVTQLAPDYAGGFVNLGSAFYRLGRWDRAEAAYRRSIELAPTSMGYQNIGTLYYYQGRFEEAVEIHERAIDVAPSDHRAWGKLAAARRYIPGQTTASQEAYVKAIDLVISRLAVDPENVEDLTYLAAYLVNTGEIEEARQNADRALSLEPDNPDARYFSAIVAIQTGEDDLALSELNRAAEFGYSTKLLHADPQFARVREHADFPQ